MSQYLSQSLSQQLRMEQRLTPQLIQSMAILQKPMADLEQFVDEALKSNAALEIPEPEAPTAGEADVAAAAESRLDRDRGLDTNGESFARLNRFARDNELDSPDFAPVHSRRFAGDGEADAKMGAMANTAGRDISLHEHLLNQWGLLDLTKEVRQAGEAIIDHLDTDGYLREPLAGVAESVRPPIPLDTLQAALREVQKLEPAGVGARDLVECLLLQLDTLPGDNAIERVLISKHLDDIAHNRLPAVQKATKFSLSEIQDAVKTMRARLTLHPGHMVGQRNEPPIRPDVIVSYADTGDGLVVRLARGNVPDLRIRDEVIKLSKARDADKETRDFARKHIEAAAGIIDAIAFRQNRLMEVSKSIVERQRDFFDVGPSALKVFRMSDLAEQLHCDPSTISRAVADKYMQTPRGMFPLRYFFTGGMETSDGESVGWDRVKTRVRELVAAEDKHSPLNDDQIADILLKEDMEISRRTVAKYRAQLDIPAARQRKEFSE